MLSEVFDEKIVCTHICINTLYSILPNLKARDKILKLSQGNTFRVHVIDIPNSALGVSKYH